MTFFNVEKIRKEFPILGQEVRSGVPLVYLDSTATAQKPAVVIDAMDNYYRTTNANIHRGVHYLAEKATSEYEAARLKIANFINANKPREIIYTRNTTESINLVAQSWGRSFLKQGDLIILTEMEHHSNLVPWHMLAQEKDLRLEFIPVTEDGELDQVVYDRLLDEGPKLVAFSHMSNVLGTINPAQEIVRKAKLAGAVTLIDGAQSVPHFDVSVKELGVDFLAFSAHKMVGPTGIGVLWGREELLNAMPPFLGGGDMIKKVLLRSFIPNELPYKFEAGTPAIAEAIGFGAAIDFLNSVGMDNIATHEHALVQSALIKLKTIPSLQVLGENAVNRGGVVSFTLAGIHPHDVAQILDQYGIAIRAGHHCAMPLHDKYGIPASSRASFYLYNTEAEVDHLVETLHKVTEMFA
ncbi:MAG: cysteine desulfurase / selenocysteine lyase [Chloroflexi bacterium]|nr:MAG: cysteine desulfurase / selenocysteine lyase [Chloroflexota bacterium]MBA4374998.1 cysteine desulfurase [Anaerolinea sp.]